MKDDSSKIARFWITGWLVNILCSVQPSLVIDSVDARDRATSRKQKAVRNGVSHSPVFLHNSKAARFFLTRAFRVRSSRLTWAQIFGRQRRERAPLVSLCPPFRRLVKSCLNPRTRTSRPPFSLPKPSDKRASDKSGFSIPLFVSTLLLLSSE